MMNNYSVYMEIMGTPQMVGSIYGNGISDAVFQYSREYINSENSFPISVSLPISDKPFTQKETKSFFEGLLPEGFSRKSVASWIKTDEEDYLSILAALGRECLGALMIVQEDEKEESGYKLLTIDKVRELASEGATRSTQILMETHLSLAGASGKVGLYYDEDKDKWYLPEGKAPSNYIVKQSHVRLSSIVQNEELCMLTAKELGIETPKCFIINTGTGLDSEVLFATNRYDRIISSEKKIDGLKVPYRLHQEDFAQAMGIASENKYERVKSGYLAKMFELIRRHTTDPIREQQHFLERIVFNYLVGNTDCHIKNHALVYSNDLKSIELSPAYDIVSTRVYKTSPEMSFYVGDEIDIERISRNSFVNASSEIGIGSRMVENIYDDIANIFEKSIKEASEILESKGFRESKELCKKILSEAPL